MLIFDALGHTTTTSSKGHQYEAATRQADVHAERWAFIANRFLGDLDQNLFKDLFDALIWPFVVDQLINMDETIFTGTQVNKGRIGLGSTLFTLPR